MSTISASNINIREHIKTLTFYGTLIVFGSMGDGADFLNEQIESLCEDWADAYPLEGEDILSYVPKKPTCKYCSKKNLRWKQVGETWVLFEETKVHNCPNCPLPLEILKKLAGL